MKIQTVVANVGGFIKILMIFMEFIAKKIGSKECNVKIINELYCYNTYENTKGKSKPGKSSMKLDNYLVKQENEGGIGIGGINESGTILNAPNKAELKMDKALSILETRTNVEDKLNLKQLNFSSLKLSVCKCCLNKKSKVLREIYLKGLENVKAKLDIVSYIKSMQIQEHVVEGIFNSTQSEVIKLYQKENLAANDYKVEITSEDINKYFKDKFKEDKISEVDMRVFDILPKQAKMELLKPSR